MNKNLLLIPARSGSTRVLNKNIRLLKGKPLISYVISNALVSGFGRVIVSTNSEEIASIARLAGAETPFLRPDNISGRDASSLSAILHAIQWLDLNESWKPEVLAFCPPTNIFTKAETIKKMYEKLKTAPHVNSIVTMTSPRTHPFRIVRQGKNGLLESNLFSIEGKTVSDIGNSQDWPEVWEGTPNCRMTRVSFFENILKKSPDLIHVPKRTYDDSNCIGYSIPSNEAMDIDTEEDWKRVESFL